MLPIINKEGILDSAITLLSMIREDLRTKHKKSSQEANIPFVCGMLNSITQAEEQDHAIVDIFEGLPYWKDKKTINEFRNDTINFVE